MRRVIVVGAGVIGLTSAVRLLEAGHRVDVMARELPLETTSAVAAAIWSPYTHPQPHLDRWGGRALEVFTELAADESSGVVVRHGTEDGMQKQLPVIEMPLFLKWLTRRVERLGGTITRMNVTALPEPDGVLVVNASGLGAKHLGHDPSVAPLRGQVAVLEQVGLDRFAIESAAPTYVIPRSQDIIVGGTAERDVWSRTPDPDTAADVLERATRLVPELATARVLRHKVGLRPDRPRVRLEREGHVVHTYGHGGCGVTLSWGCAEDVVELARE